MNLKQWMDDLLIQLSDEVEIEFINKRYYLPDAAYSRDKKENKDIITIYGNAPSLVRAGILYLLGHELAHHEHEKKYGHRGDDYSSSFVEIETGIKHQIWEIYLNEHENREMVSD